MYVILLKCNACKQKQTTQTHSDTQKHTETLRHTLRNTQTHTQKRTLVFLPLSLSPSLPPSLYPFPSFVQRLDQRRLLLGHHAAFELEGGSQIPVLFAEFLVQDGVPLDELSAARGLAVGRLRGREGGREGG